MDKEKKEMGFLDIIRNRFFKAAFAAYLFICTFMTDMYTCFAGSKGSDDAAKELEDKVTGPMTIIINIVLTGVQVFGVLFLIKSIIDLVDAINASDHAGISRCAKSIIAALLLVSLKLVVKIFGYEG